MKADSPDLEMVRKHVNELGDHFDSVQIFCTRCESGTLDGTVHVDVGAGNWFSRFGQVSQWIVKENESARIGVRKEE